MHGKDTIVHSDDSHATGTRPGDRRSWRCAAPVIVLAMLCLAAPARAASEPGRFLATESAIAECNSDASNCFTVVSNGSGGSGGDSLPSGATSASLATNGTIAFDAIWGIDGSCSPGGQGICRSHVFLMDADGTNVRQITFNPVGASAFGGDNSAAISPDGTMVAFISNRNPAYNPNDPNHTPTYLYQLYIVNSDGSGLRQVTFPVYGVAGSPQAGIPFGEISGAAWSPDSQKLAFKGWTYGATPCGTFFGFPVPCRVVGTINADGTGLTYLAIHDIDADSTVFAVDWSPDGTLIAYGRSPSLGDPAVAFIDLSGQGRYAAGLTLAQLGNSCGAPQCIHFSPGSTQLAYVNAGHISTINLDGTGRVDTAVTVGGQPSGASPAGIWWAPGTIPPAAQLTLAPDPVEVWPGYSQPLTPALLDAGTGVILHTAATYNISHSQNPSCAVQIGPYGLVMYSSGSGVGGSISVTNAGLTSNSVPFKCWASAPCAYALGASGQTFSACGGSDSVGVTADPGPNDSTCPWSATSDASWIGITSGPGGSGNGQASFTVAANTGPARQGTITVAGETFTVSQDGAPCSPADLAITKTDSPDPVPVGSNLTYTITVTNNGPSAATGVTMTDSLPGTVTFVSATPAQGNCGGTSTISCNLGTLPNGGSTTVTIVVTPTLAGAISNTASVAGNEADPDTNNNAATQVTTVDPPVLSALGPAKLWVGQDDATRPLKFDLMAEVLVNGTVAGSGQLANVSAGGSRFWRATLDTVSLTLESATSVPAGATLSIRASVRLSCSAKRAGTSGVARLWYNGQPIDTGNPAVRDAGSRFSATIGGANSTYFLRQGFTLATAAGSARKFIDVAVDDADECPARSFTPFGTWSVTLP